MKKWIKVLSGLLAVLLVACIGLVAWMYSIYKGISDDPFSAFKKPSTGSTITVKDSQNIEHTQTQGVVNILLLGIDSNAICGRFFVVVFHRVPEVVVRLFDVNRLDRLHAQSEIVDVFGQ